VRRSRLKEKVNRRTDGRTDAGQIAMAIAHLSLRLWWAKNAPIAWRLYLTIQRNIFWRISLVYFYGKRFLTIIGHLNACMTRH